MITVALLGCASGGTAAGDHDPTRSRRWTLAAGPSAICGERDVVCRWCSGRITAGAVGIAGAGGDGSGRPMGAGGGAGFGGAVSTGEGGSVGPVGDGAGGMLHPPQTCDVYKVGPTEPLWLTNREYDNTIRDLMGDASAPSIATGFPEDVTIDGFRRDRVIP